MAEVLERRTLFPASAAKENLTAIRQFFDHPMLSVASLPLEPSPAVRVRFEDAPPSCVDLMCHLLALHPAGRPSALEALAFPFVEDDVVHANLPPGAHDGGSCKCCEGVHQRCEFCGHSKRHNKKAPFCKFDHFFKSSAAFKRVDSEETKLEAAARTFRALNSL